MATREYTYTAFPDSIIIDGGCKFINTKIYMRCEMSNALYSYDPDTSRFLTEYTYPRLITAFHGNDTDIFVGLYNGCVYKNGNISVNQPCECDGAICDIFVKKSTVYIAHSCQTRANSGTIVVSVHKADNLETIQILYTGLRAIFAKLNFNDPTNSLLLSTKDKLVKLSINRRMYIKQKTMTDVRRAPQIDTGSTMFTCDSSYVYVTGAFFDIEIYDVSTFSLVWRLSQMTYPYFFCVDNPVIYTAIDANCIYRLDMHDDIETGDMCIFTLYMDSKILYMKKHKNTLIVLTPDGVYSVSDSAFVNSSLTPMDVEEEIESSTTFVPMAVYGGHRDFPVITTGNSMYLFTAGYNGDIIQWHIHTRAWIRTYRNHKIRPLSVRLFDNHIISASVDGQVCVHDISTGAVLKEFIFTPPHIDCILFDSLRHGVFVMYTTKQNVLYTHRHDLSIEGDSMPIASHSFNAKIRTMCLINEILVVNTDDGALTYLQSTDLKVLRIDMRNIHITKMSQVLNTSSILYTVKDLHGVFEFDTATAVNSVRSYSTCDHRSFSVSDFCCTTFGTVVAISNQGYLSTWTRESSPKLLFSHPVILNDVSYTSLYVYSSTRVFIGTTDNLVYELHDTETTNIDTSTEVINAPVDQSHPMVYTTICDTQVRSMEIDDEPDGVLYYSTDHKLYHKDVSCEMFSRMKDYCIDDTGHFDYMSASGNYLITYSIKTGILHVYQTDNYRLDATIPMPYKLTGISLNSETSRIYATTSKYLVVMDMLGDIRKKIPSANCKIFRSYAGLLFFYDKHHVYTEEYEIIKTVYSTQTNIISSIFVNNRRGIYIGLSNGHAYYYILTEYFEEVITYTPPNRCFNKPVDRICVNDTTVFIVWDKEIGVYCRTTGDFSGTLAVADTITGIHAISKNVIITACADGTVKAWNMSQYAIDSKSLQEEDSTPSDTIVKFEFQDSFDIFKDSCNNNLYTLTEYTKQDNPIAIYMLNTKSKFDKCMCMTEEELSAHINATTDISVQLDKYTKISLNIMSMYTSPTSRDPQAILAGLSCKPTGKLVIKLPVNNTYITVGSAERIVREMNYNRIWYALPMYSSKKRRLGNTLGIIGISMLHGQIPGEIIYKLFSKEELLKTKDNKLAVTENILDFPMYANCSGDELSEISFTQLCVSEKTHIVQNNLVSSILDRFNTLFSMSTSSSPCTDS